MQQQIDEIQNLIQLLINPPSSNTKKQEKYLAQPNTSEIDALEVSDYLQLSAHQKKAITQRKWHRLVYINESGILEQQDYKHMFALACQAHYRRLEHPGYYKKLLEVKQTYPSNLFLPVQKDVPRTFPPTHPFYQSLKNVLIAYAIRNPSLVYCQGMNYFVAYFLINQVSEEQAFWIVACLVQNCLPDDYFKDLTTISIIVCIFEDVIDELVPQFKLILQEAGMESSVVLVTWFVCLFSKGFLTSVSAYLITYLMLQSREYRAGYILLKISIAILSAILQCDEHLPFSKDFKTLKDEIQLFVVSISLEQIKESIKQIRLDYSTYIKLQDYYKKQKNDARTLMLKSRKRKLPLPNCNKEYPICFHRIEIQKKLGAFENAMILKNGMSIKDQMIEDYLETELSNQTNDISYSTFQQCEVGRQAHICHLNQRESEIKVDLRQHKYEKQRSRIQLLEDNDESVECQMHLSTYQERFKEVSEFFIIDEDYLQNNFQSEQKHYEEELQKQFEYFSIERPLPEPVQSLKPELKSELNQVEPQKKGFKAFLTQTFEKVRLKISQFQHIKQLRRSRNSAEPPNIEIKPVSQTKTT